MNVDITYNDLYNAGIQDQKINLMYECDKSSSISIKTPYGLTSREEVSKTIAQGEVMSSIKCTTSVDSIAQQAEENISEHLYKYRDTLVIPPLHCVDDQLLISPCGLDSVVTTAYINCQTNLKKLQCRLLHVGKKDLLCPDLMVDSWDLVPRDGTATSILDMADTPGPQHCLESVDHDNYLGCIQQANGSNDKNVQERKNRGLEKATNITLMLDELCLGDYYFQSGNILRNSILLSSLLFSSEAWYNVTKRQIQDLEMADETLLRKIFAAHSKTPIELLYTESGNVPVRFILMGRRLNFLWYLLHEERESLLSRFFHAQLSSPGKGDWVLTVQEDIVNLEISMDMEGITATSQSRFKSIVRNRTGEAIHLPGQDQDHRPPG